MGIKISFAGPLFTVFEREWITQTVGLLRAQGFDPFALSENPFYPEDYLQLSRQ